MRYLYVVVFILLLISIFVAAQTDISTRVSDCQGMPKPPDTKQDLAIATFEEQFILADKSYTVHFTAPIVPARVKLIANYSQKQVSRDVFEAHKCDVLTNAGFYLADNSPVGLVVIEGDILSPFRKNDLFNSVMYFGESGAKISKDGTLKGFAHAMQSGPALVVNGKNVVLTLNNDKLARRSFVGITKNGDIVLGMITDSINLFLGPLLADMPRMMALLNDTYKLDLVDAINLDGGSASVYVTSNLSIAEIAPVGAFFCAW